MQAPVPFYETFLAVCCLYPMVLLTDWSAWMYENAKGFLVACLVVSNLAALRAVQESDLWINAGVFVMMLLSMTSHALEVLPNFLENPVYKKANRADAVFMCVLIALVVFRLGWVHDVPIELLIQENWGLALLALVLALLNFCSVKLRSARQPEFYAVYVLFHTIWHLGIYDVLAQFLSICFSYSPPSARS